MKELLIVVCCPVTLSSGDLLAVTSFRYNFTCFTCDTKTEALVNHSCRLMHTFTWGEHYRAQNRSPSRWQGRIYLTRQLFKSCLTSCNKALGDDLWKFFGVFFLYEKLGLRMSGDTCIYEMGGAKDGGEGGRLRGENIVVTLSRKNLCQLMHLYLPLGPGEFYSLSHRE